MFFTALYIMGELREKLKCHIMLAKKEGEIKLLAKFPESRWQLILLFNQQVDFCENLRINRTKNSYYEKKSKYCIFKYNSFIQHSRLRTQDKDHCFSGKHI